MTVRVDPQGLLNALERLATDRAVRLGDLLVEKAQSRVSRRTGNTYNSIQADPPVVSDTEVTVRVHVDEPSAKYQDEGTGIYGPDGQRIYPTRSRVLVFDWPAAGGIVFARSVAGAPGTHFWTEALGAWPQLVATAANERR